MVKYNDLAHVHNRWLSEKELLANAPLLLRKFNRKSQKEKVNFLKFYTLYCFLAQVFIEKC